MKTNKKKAILICGLLLGLILIGVFSLNRALDDKDTMISSRIDVYESEPTAENLQKLCTELLGYTDYQNILKYYPMYLKDDIAFTFAKNSGMSEFMAKRHVAIYKIDYCLVLLHLSDFESFEKNFYELQSEISGNDLIYYYLSSEIETRSYSNEQLELLVKLLSRISDENTKSKLSNLSLQAYIYDILGNETEYTRVLGEIEQLEKKKEINIKEPT